MTNKGKTIIMQMYNCDCKESTLLDSAIITNYTINAAKIGNQRFLTSDRATLIDREGIAINYILEYGFLSIRTNPSKKYIIVILTSFKYANFDGFVKELYKKFKPEKFELFESGLNTEGKKVNISTKTFVRDENGDYTTKKVKKKTTKKKTTKKKTTKKKTQKQLKKEAKEALKELEETTGAKFKITSDE